MIGKTQMELKISRKDSRNLLNPFPRRYASLPELVPFFRNDSDSDKVDSDYDGEYMTTLRRRRRRRSRERKRYLMRSWTALSEFLLSSDSEEEPVRRTLLDHRLSSPYTAHKPWKSDEHTMTGSIHLTPTNLTQDEYFKKEDEEKTKNDEATADLNECIQSKLNRKVYDFLQELLRNSDNPVREKKIRSILCDINSVTKPLNTPQDQLPTMELVFRDAGKSDEYTTGETPSCQSKSANIPVKEEHLYSDCTLSNVEIIEIENIIKLKSEVDMIEFCDCKLGNDYCTPGESRKKCKISKLIISFTDNFEEFFRFIYSTFGGCEIKSLCLLYDNLDDQDVDNLQRFMVKGIENLDLSYNKKISPDGFKQIGNIIAEQGIKTLKAMNCDLEKTKLEKLFEGLKNVNLQELDIGYNDKLTGNGFEMLAKLVASRGIETLKLRGCQLTEKTIQVFYNTLEKTDKKRLLNELDVSYNPKMNPEGYEILGLIIKKFGITTLNLAGCGISEKHLKSLMSMKDIKVNAINLRDNSYPGNNMVEIANIVREFKIQELDISDCMFSARKLRNFRTDLNGTKLQKLHLGDKSCELGMEYIQEVCQLLPTVKETLYLRFHRLDNSCRRLLKEKSENLSVSIQLCEEPQVTLDK